jgi:hypothetical protein
MKNELRKYYFKVKFSNDTGRNWSSRASIQSENLENALRDIQDKVTSELRQEHGESVYDVRVTLIR